MNLLYPTFDRRLLPRMLGLALLGSVIAGGYGILHDQVTYTLSPEYFTRMKFEQFHYADFGFPRRIFVSEIGFLATWWVGFFSGWFLARITYPVWSPEVAFRKSAGAFLTILATAVVAAPLGYLLSLKAAVNHPFWREMTDELGIVDVRAFVQVAYIHYASYLGGLLGLVISIVTLVRQKIRDPRPSLQT